MQQLSIQERLCGIYLVIQKIMMRAIIDKMIDDRRLGRYLKGMNRANMMEIENAAWSAIMREIDLYKNNKQYKKSREVL